MTNVIRPNTCATCAFKHREANGQLVCRRNPPVGHPIILYVEQKSNVTAQPMTALVPQVQGTMSVFPTVEPDWWCGAHSGLASRPEAARPNGAHIHGLSAA